ncbi:uncharacterized protein LOC133872006 [Alnus glutinosa]|uniref:uncharacterized protein LOC133872006 n=1 Tax=Alnus glutinosa TaxID=3517 RepID=UPI002D767AB5|nr:uncharacterized protein LOC133872006 [Alnus glutinosa]
MGACFSSVIGSRESRSSQPTAKIISVNGSLREYPVPVYVSQVLEAESSSSSSSSSSSPRFLCNSDSLYYDDYIPVLDLDDELQANQIYFVLPASKLRQRLTASDMAALAVKASVALQNASTKNGHRRNKARISPVLVVNQSISLQSNKLNHDDGYAPKWPKKATGINGKPGGGVAGGLSRSGSVRKLQRYTSKRAKMAVRSFRLRLSTIYEGAVL